MSGRVVGCRRLVHVSACVFVLLLLGGCTATRPEVLGERELLEAVSSDRAAMTEGVEPLLGRLTLEEAQARAVKYNLEVRVRRLEEVVARRRNDLSRLDMLPELLVQAGYTSRDNDRISRSRDQGSSSGALIPSRYVSQERSHVVSELGFNWSVLDFGLGALRASQDANRALVAREQRRRALHLLLQDVRVAFWKVVTRQRMSEEVGRTIALAEGALSNARQIEAARIRDPGEILRYQRQLLENMRLLEAIQEELASAEVELAQLTNLPVGKGVEVEEPTLPGDDEALLGLPWERLEEVALLRNADGLEQAYNVRNARLEGEALLLGLVPHLSLGVGLNSDDDRYLLNNRWQEVSSQLSFDLLKLLSVNRVRELNRATLALAVQRRVAANATTIAKVHLARLQLEMALSQLKRAQEIHEADRRYAELVGKRETALFQNRLDRVSAETAALLSLLRKYQALAERQAAGARLVATLGGEPEIPEGREVSLPELVRIMSAGVVSVPEANRTCGTSDEC